MLVNVVEVLDKDVFVLARVVNVLVSDTVLEDTEVVYEGRGAANLMGGAVGTTAKSYYSCNYPRHSSSIDRRRILDTSSFSWLVFWSAHSLAI
jgi:hypothetical protein